LSLEYLLLHDRTDTLQALKKDGLDCAAAMEYQRFCTLIDPTWNAT